MVRLIEADSRLALEITDNDLSLVVESDPHGVVVHIVDNANLRLVELEEAYEYVGDEDAATSHEIDELLEGDGPWHIVITNEHTSSPVAVSIELEAADDDDEEEDEEGE